MKTRCLFILILLLSVFFMLPVKADTEMSLTMQDNQVIVMNAPENSMLIALFYKGSSLSDVRIVRGSKTIIMDISKEMENADTTKMFLWDHSTLTAVSEKSESMKNKIKLEVNGHILTATL